VDEPGWGTADQRRVHLDRWWREVRAAHAGHPAGDPFSIALAWALSAYPIPLAAFEELYLGLLMDLEGVAFATLMGLELYCRRVGGVVGWMVAPICGYGGGAETLQHALRLGQAMQLTNILRDVGEDLAQGRVYLPAELLARHGLDRDALQDRQVTDAYRALMRELVTLARAWYREAEPGLLQLHAPGRLAVAVAARAYEGILDQLERNGYDNFARRASVGNGRRVLLVPATYWRIRARSTVRLRWTLVRGMSSLPFLGGLMFRGVPARRDDVEE
jgi:phytoene synthase